MLSPRNFTVRIPKKWKWTGDLSLQNGMNDTEMCCPILISEASDPRVSAGLKFSYCLVGIETIRLSKTVSAVHLPMILAACQPVQQLARVAADSARLGGNISVVANYMHHKGLVSCAPRAY
jgi:hypothetical protein